MISLVLVLVFIFTPTSGFSSLSDVLRSWHTFQPGTGILLIVLWFVPCFCSVGFFWCCYFFFGCFFVNKYKSEYVKCCSTRRSCCSEFMGTRGGCPTWRGLRIKSPSVVSRVMWSGAAGCAGWTSERPGRALGVWWTIWKANTMQVLNWQLASQNGCGLIFPCSVSAKAKLKKFTFCVYDFHQGFQNISVGGRKANFSPTFCNDSYSLQYF